MNKLGNNFELLTVDIENVCFLVRNCDATDLKSVIFHVKCPQIGHFVGQTVSNRLTTSTNWSQNQRPFIQFIQSHNFLRTLNTQKSVT